MVNLILDLTERFSKDEVLALASQLAYNLLLSFFPFIIFLMTLIGFTSLGKLDTLIGLSSIFPESVTNLIKYTVTQAVNSKSSSLLSVSLVFTLWPASSGFNAVIRGLNKAYGVKENRSFLKVRLISLLSTIGMTLVIIIMGFLLILGTVISAVLARKYPVFNDLMPLWIILRYVIIVFTTIFIFSALYHYGPCRKLSWTEVCYGSIFSTFSIIIVSALFAYYVNNFARYSVVYGSIGAIIVLLIWLFLVSIIIILGGELNASLAFQHEVKNKLSFKIMNKFH